MYTYVITDYLGSTHVYNVNGSSLRTLAAHRLKEIALGTIGIQVYGFFSCFIFTSRAALLFVLRNLTCVLYVNARNKCLYWKSAFRFFVRSITFALAETTKDENEFKYTFAEFPKKNTNFIKRSSKIYQNQTYLNYRIPKLVCVADGQNKTGFLFDFTVDPYTIIAVRILGVSTTEKTIRYTNPSIVLLVFNRSKCTHGHLWSMRVCIMIVYLTRNVYNSFQSPLCTEKACLGSIMHPPVFHNSTVRPKAEVLELAEDFMKQYFASIKRWAFI